MREETEPPYWLDGGSECCEGCGHAFVVEVGYHCAVCDRGVCAECVLTLQVTSERVCPGCRTEEGEG